METSKRPSFTGWFQLITYILLIGAVLMLTVTGGKIYQAVTLQKTANEQLRSTTAFLQSQVAAADTADQISITTGPEGDALCLRFGDGTYQTVIYLYDGSLVEQVLAVDAAFSPEDADVIASVDSFAVTLTTPNQLAFQVNGATFYAALRSGGVG
jgi:hypothetical protein